jgi:hypothetical protein
MFATSIDGDGRLDGAGREAYRTRWFMESMYYVFGGQHQPLPERYEYQKLSGFVSSKTQKKHRSFDPVG